MSLRRFGAKLVKDGQIQWWVTTDRYHKFNEWMPYVTFDNRYAESCPMQTQFTSPEDKRPEVVATMRGQGYEYVEKNKRFI